MSGGDDLESEDEYLDQSWGKSETVKVAVDDSFQAEERRKKRSLPETEENGDEIILAISSNKKKKISGKNLILEAGRGIAGEDENVQAEFLWACLTNTLKMRGEEIPERQIIDSDFAKGTINSHDNATNRDPSLAKFLKSGVLSSNKKLKKWKHSQSPMVIIICVSARRAVSVLKEISSLNVRAAKLFAKHMSIEDQIAMLENNNYSIAVGTPNRLLKLCEEDEETHESPLNFDQTELIVIDSHEDKKKYTVCTMNDTAPDLMMLFKKSIIPQLERRKSLKLAFF